MTISRRAFIASLGVGAAAVAMGGVSLPADDGGTLSMTASTGAALDAPLLVGDIFTISGRYAIHPVTRKKTRQLQQFMVTAVTGEDVTCIPRSVARRSELDPVGAQVNTSA